MDKVESGLQLFERAKKVPTTKLLPKFFINNGPNPEEFVEIVGETGSGKTYLLTYYLIKCALPREYNNIPLNGYNCKVIFINCDHKFEILQFVSILEKFIKTNIPLVYMLRDDIIKMCLENISILNCYEHNQYLITLQNLERIVKYDEPTLICIDSICPYYWSVALENTYLGFTSYYNDIIDVIKGSTKFKNVIHIYTRDINFKLQEDKVVHRINYRVSVSKCIDSFLVDVEYNDKLLSKHKIDLNLNIINLDT